MLGRYQNKERHKTPKLRGESERDTGRRSTPPKVSDKYEDDRGKARSNTAEMR